MNRDNVKVEVKIQVVFETNTIAFTILRHQIQQLQYGMKF